MMIDKRCCRIFIKCVFIGALFLFLTACNTKVQKTYPDLCISSFEKFAYSWPDPEQSPYETVLPLAPWQEIANIPEMTLASYPHDTYHVEIIRSSGEHSDVWLAAFDGRFFDLEDAEHYHFMVYHTETKRWEIFSSATDDPQIYVGRLFLAGDGSIWGQNFWDFSKGKVEMPALSRFDEASNSFRIENESRISTIRLEGRSSHPPYQIVYYEGLFWVLVLQDAIYMYDTTVRELKRQIDFPMVVWDIALASDGSIFFDTPPVWEKGSIIEVQKLIKFNPANRELEPLEFPPGLWPPYWKMLVDSHDRLWLDAVGWREANGRWHRLYPNPLRYWWMRITNDKYMWINPTAEIMLQSKDGRLWFRKNDLKEASDTQGVAWYNPQTKQGCWVTSEPAIVMEDHQAILWMVADGKLYQNALQP